MASWLEIGVGVGVGLEAVLDLGVLGDEGGERQLAVDQVVVLEDAHVRRVVLERDELALLPGLGLGGSGLLGVGLGGSGVGPVSGPVLGVGFVQTLTLP